MISKTIGFFGAHDIFRHTHIYQATHGHGSSSKTRNPPIGLAFLNRMSTLPSGYVKIAIENDHRNSGFSH